MAVIQIITTIEAPEADDVKLAEAVNKIYDFIVGLMPELKGRMNSPVRVTIKKMSENEQQEGEVKP